MDCVMFSAKGIILMEKIHIFLIYYFFFHIHIIYYIIVLNFSYLLPERGRSVKQKTPVIRRTLSPRWEHSFLYRGVSLLDLHQRALELSVWDRDRLSTNDFMGGVRFSLGTGNEIFIRLSI